MDKGAGSYSRYLDGDDTGMAELIRDYRDGLLLYLNSYLNDLSLAEDCVQETFIKAYRNLGSFRRDASERTWLNRIAINTCKDMRRTGWFRHVDRSFTPDLLPETAAPVDEQSEALTLAVMNLPVKLREAALLCWLQGMTYEEAADVLGITHQAVSSRLNRARKKLRRALEGSDDHEPA